MNKYIKILQWNCRSVRSKIYELQKFVCDFDVILLVETWLTPGYIFHLSNFETVRFDRSTNSRGGIAFFVKKGIKFEVLKLKTEINTLETGAISIKTSMGNIAIVGCYRKPTGCNKLCLQEWNSFIEEIQELKTYVIGGDLNAHHPVWGSEISCINGKIIFENLDPEYFFYFKRWKPYSLYCTRF